MKNINHLISPHGKNFAGWCSQGGGAGVAALAWEHVALPLLREQLMPTPDPLINHRCVGWEGQDDFQSSSSSVCCYS